MSIQTLPCTLGPCHGVVYHTSYTVAKPSHTDYGIAIFCVTAKPGWKWGLSMHAMVEVGVESQKKKSNKPKDLGRHQWCRHSFILCISSNSATGKSSILVVTPSPAASWANTCGDGAPCAGSSAPQTGRPCHHGESTG